MNTKRIILSLTLVLAGVSLVKAQVIQDFNQSVNQIGNCWSSWNMYIETRNTLNKANEKKALTGRTPTGFPAYYFTSPLLSFAGTGSIDFRHKLDVNDGDERSLTVQILDSSENPVMTIYTHTYRTGNACPYGDATIIQNTSIPVTFTGNYYVRWSWDADGGTSVAMVDDIIMDAEDISDHSTDNGYGYCRADDDVYDTVCAGTQDWDLQVPFPIASSDWTWVFYPAASVGSLDSTVVSGPIDTLVQIDWNFVPGSYYVEATEIRPPYYTTTYSVNFYIEVLPYPQVAIEIDSICYPGPATMNVSFTGGTGPWTLTYTDGSNNYSHTISVTDTSISLPPYSSTTNITVTGLTDANGCDGDPTTYPTAPAVIYPRPSTGLID